MKRIYEKTNEGYKALAIREFERQLKAAEQSGQWGKISIEAFVENGKITSVTTEPKSVYK